MIFHATYEQNVSKVRENNNLHDKRWINMCSVNTRKKMHRDEYQRTSALKKINGGEINIWIIKCIRDNV